MSFIDMWITFCNLQKAGVVLDIERTLQMKDYLFILFGAISIIAIVVASKEPAEIPSMGTIDLEIPEEEVILEDPIQLIPPTFTKEEMEMLKQVLPQLPNEAPEDCFDCHNGKVT